MMCWDEPSCYNVNPGLPFLVGAGRVCCAATSTQSKEKKVPILPIASDTGTRPTWSQFMGEVIKQTIKLHTRPDGDELTTHMPTVTFLMLTASGMAELGPENQI